MIKETCVCGKPHDPESRTWRDHHASKKFHKPNQNDVFKDETAQTTPKPETPVQDHSTTPKVSQEPTIDAVFRDNLGQERKVADFIEQKDCWKLEKRGATTIQWIISNKGIRRLAEVAGIGKNYEVKESPNIVPKPENSMLHVVEITIHCYGTKEGSQGCVHDDFESTLTMTGEADKKNARRGGDYLRLMAEKRGYDRAVIRHLGIENVYSEEEASAFENKEDEQKVDVLTNEDLEKLAPMINLIINATNLEQLKAAAEYIKLNSSTLNDLSIQYLRAKYSQTYQQLAKEF